MSSYNPSGADNQQGRSLRILTPDYVAGFVDGEGCFCVSIHPHPSVSRPTRWLLAPCFQVYQLASNVGILEQLQSFFACGKITAKGPNSSVMTYSVYRRSDLESVIVPFFSRYPLVSRKHEDFLKFKEIVLAMQQKVHLTETGFDWIVETAFSMNQRGKQRRYRLEEVLAKPSETVRRASDPHQLELAKIQSEPYGDIGRAAEMTAPPAGMPVGGNRTA